MTEHPLPPRRTRWLVPALIVVTASLVVAVAMLLSRPNSTTATSPAATVTAPTTTTDSLNLDASQQAAQRQVDAAVAMDGVAVDWSSTHVDAYQFTALFCSYLNSVDPTAMNWYKIPIPGVMTRGGMEALVTGVPYVCPQYSKFVATAQASFFPGG